jgi:hypothetical protein
VTSEIAHTDSFSKRAAHDAVEKSGVAGWNKKSCPPHQPRSRRQDNGVSRRAQKRFLVLRLVQPDNGAHRIRSRPAAQVRAMRLRSHPLAPTNVTNCMIKFYLVQVRMHADTRELCSAETMAVNLSYVAQSVVDRSTTGPRPTVEVMGLKVEPANVQQLDAFVEQFIKKIT